MKCPDCGALTGQGKNGLTENGVQRFRCCACGRRYVASDSRRVDDGARREAQNLLRDGYSIRRAAAEAGVSVATVGRWRQAGLSEATSAPTIAVPNRDKTKAASETSAVIETSDDDWEVGLKSAREWLSE